MIPSPASTSRESPRPRRPNGFAGPDRARRASARGRGSPDGLRPHGFVTYLDYLRHSAASRGLAPDGKSPPWMMTAHQCAEADREFIQFYHRRIAWLALRRHDKAIQDADHTLALMDFVRRHAQEEDYVASHEQFRGIVLFHRTEAAIALALERHRPEEAIDALRDGIERLTTHQRTWWEDHDPADSPNLALVDQLRTLRAGYPQEVRGRKDPARTARRGRRPGGLRAGRPASRPDPSPEASAAVDRSRVRRLSSAHVDRHGRQ